MKKNSIEVFKWASVAVILSWLLSYVWLFFSGGAIGIEAIGITLSRLKGNLMNLPLLLDVAHFFVVQFIVNILLILITALAAIGLCALALIRPRLSVLLVSIYLYSIILLINSALYPLSVFSIELPPAAWIFPAIWVGVAISLILLLKGVGELLGKLGLLGVLVVSVAGYFLTAGGTNQRPGNASQLKPNIFVIGVDGVRPDKLMSDGAEESAMPLLEARLASGDYYENTYTPIARTYASWSAILTGRYPKNSGIRFNLQEDDSVNKNLFITWQLKSLGYTTVWALDDKKFNNIDRSYGFDLALGPKNGASEYLMSYLSDMPLVNLLTNVSVGGKLFPQLKNNRVNFKVYNPYLYSDELVSTVANIKGPLFGAFHFCLPHYPYVNNLMRRSEGLEPTVGISEGNYLSMLDLVDRQVERFIEGLREEGLLDNAIVYVLSDHGEQFDSNDGFLQGNPYANFNFGGLGHGTNIMSRSQYQVVLAKFQFNKGVAAGGSKLNRLTSLIDVAPDIYAELGEASGKFDGLALPVDNPDRHIYLESSYSMAALSESRINLVSVLLQGVNLYRIGDDGRLYFRADLFDEVLKAKQRAVVSRGGILSVYPDEKNYMFFGDFEENKWWPVSKSENLGAPAEWAELTESLCDFFGGDPGFEGHSLCEK